MKKFFKDLFNVGGIVAGVFSVVFLATTAIAALSLNVSPTGVANNTQTIGGIGSNGGLQELGSSSTLPIGTPTAPTVTNNGTAGASSLIYYCVATDINGNDSIPSSSTTNTTSNATLSATNYNLVFCPGKAGAVQFKILKADTTHTIGNCYANSQGAGCGLNDIGQSSTAYAGVTNGATLATANTVDQTGVIKGARDCSGTVTVTAGSITIVAPCVSNYNGCIATVKSPLPPVAGDLPGCLLTSTATIIASATVTVGAINIQVAGTPSPSPAVMWSVF